jgi:hypothetical protein
MSKAIEGAALLGVAAGIWFLVPGSVVFAPWLMTALVGMVAGGVSMEGAALADALTQNRGQNITTRQAAGLRQIIYGQQRVGGTTVYQSTTGAGGSGGNYVYNYIIALASHEIDAVINIYLDGRQVYWSQFDGDNGANIGCGTVSAPPTAVVTISGGAVTGVTASGGSGFGNIKAGRYRVRFSGGGGSGAYGYATNAGAGTYGTDFVVGAWTVVVTHPGSGYTTPPQADIQGAYTFGGTGAADQQDPSLPGYGLGYGIGPGGPHYDFAGKVFCEVRFGDQPPGDYMASLSANDSTWPTTANGGGVAYLYLNVGYDVAQFPAAPEIRVTVNGKNNIWDPRTSAYGFSSNWALQVADVIADPQWGLGDNAVNQAQLIAAANVCDELIATSQGDESNFQQHLHYDSSTAPGDALSLMMPSAAGRLSRVGGEWFIWPAYWQGPSFAFDQSALVDPSGMAWKPYRSQKDLVNVINGTYIAPNYPYAVAGNLYDANGWYYGTTNNLWPFAWQPTNFPAYAQDVLHGYAANEELIEDLGIVLPKELTLRGVISIVQAQRVAKINLMRNRRQGSGVFPMSLAAWQMAPIDVQQFTFPQMGWSDKYLEVDKIQLVCEPMKDATGEDGALALSTAVSAQETGPSDYEWSETEELTPYDVAAIAQQIPYTPAAPTEATVTSSAGTAIIGADGSVTPRALVAWNAPADNTVTGVDVQYQLFGATTWLDAGITNVALFEALVGPLIAGDAYNFQIRSVRPSGSYSPWVQVLNVTISITLASSATSGDAIAPAGTLVALALSTGTANIIVQPFEAVVGVHGVACLPAGSYTITGLAQGQAFYVYYIDPTFAGGAITPIATQNAADFLNKVGYFLIGDIVTPNYVTTYTPSSYADTGASATANPANAYGGNPTLASKVQGYWSSTSAGAAPPVYETFSYFDYEGICTWSGFPSVVATAAKTLNITAGFALGNCAAMYGYLGVTIAGVTATVATSLGTLGAILYTVTIPSGTDLSTVSVTAQCTVTNITLTYVDPSPNDGTAIVSVSGIFIQ